MHDTCELPRQPCHRARLWQSRRLADSSTVTGRFSRYATAQSNHTATFRRSTSLSAQGVDKSVELRCVGVQSLGTGQCTDGTGKTRFRGFPVLSHPEPTLCPPAGSRPDLRRDAVVHTFHRTYSDDFLLLPELHKLFFRSVHAHRQPASQPAIHPVTTSGRRRERKYP